MNMLRHDMLRHDMCRCWSVAPRLELRMSTLILRALVWAGVSALSERLLFLGLRARSSCDRRPCLDCNAALPHFQVARKRIPNAYHRSLRDYIRSCLMELTKASTASSGMLKGSDRLDGGQHGKTDEAEADQALMAELVQAPRSMSDQAAAHREHVPLATVQAAIFTSPDLEPARHSSETSIRQLQNIPCTFTTITADSTQPVFVNGLTGAPFQTHH